MRKRKGPTEINWKGIGSRHEDCEQHKKTRQGEHYGIPRCEVDEIGLLLKLFTRSTDPLFCELWACSMLYTASILRRNVALVPAQQEERRNKASCTIAVSALSV